MNFLFDNDTANRITSVHNLQNALLIDNYILLQVVSQFGSIIFIVEKYISEQIFSPHEYTRVSKNIFNII